MAQMMRAILLASATATSFFGLRASNPNSHGAARPFLGLLDHRHGAEHQQPAQTLVTRTTDFTEPLSAAGRVLARRDAKPRRKVPGRAKTLRIGHLESKADAADRADAGDGGQALAGLVLAMPGHQPRFDLPQLGIKSLKLARQDADHLARQCRHAPLDDKAPQELTNLLSSLWHSDAKLRRMTTDRVDQHGALLDQQIAHPEDGQRRLALSALDRHKPHT